MREQQQGYLCLINKLLVIHVSFFTNKVKCLFTECSDKRKQTVNVSAPRATKHN